MNKSIPANIGVAKVIYVTEIDERHERTGNTNHFVGGETFSDIKGLAICQYENETGFYNKPLSIILIQNNLLS